MSKLTAKTRNALPKAAFAGPDRSYPVQDKAHAANAKARAHQALNAGRMSEAQEEKIEAKANRVLGKGHHETQEQEKARGADHGTGKTRGYGR